MEFFFVTNRESETITLGNNIGKLLQSGDVVALVGDLGSGKTCLVRGICNGLNCVDDISSPTFTIINEYQGKYPVFHFDFYRIESDQEIFDLGYEEYFYDSGVCLVEWADRALAFLPRERIEVYLTGIFEPGKENSREIKLILKGEKIKHRPWSRLINQA